MKLNNQLRVHFECVCRHSLSKSLHFPSCIEQHAIRINVPAVLTITPYLFNNTCSTILSFSKRSLFLSINDKIILTFLILVTHPTYPVYCIIVYVMTRYCVGKRTDYDLPYSVFSSLVFLFLMSNYSSQYVALKCSQLKDASTFQKARLWNNNMRVAQHSLSLPLTESNIIQGGSNMTGTDLYVNKPHCAAAVRPWESEATTFTLPPARVRTSSVLSGSC